MFGKAAKVTMKENTILNKSHFVNDRGEQGNNNKGEVIINRTDSAVGHNLQFSQINSFLLSSCTSCTCTYSFHRLKQTSQGRAK